MSKMGNKEFDKKIRELMEAHTEVPPVGSWDLIELSLSRKKRARVLYFRRGLYTAVAVAASLALFLVLNESSLDSVGTIKVVEQKEVVANLETLDSSQVKPEHSVESKKSAVISQQILVAKERLAIKVESVQERELATEKPASEKQTTVEKQITTEMHVTNHVKQPEGSLVNDNKESKPRSVYPVLEDYKSVSRRKRSPLVAFATNLSPSTGSNTVSLMAMSQAQGGFAPNDVVSTIQKAYVPQEVISNTKFLMPVSVGVQVQMPLSKLLSVGLGVNYTLLFSHYDALSRQETRETQQTLHYIGVPFNVYLNIMQKDNLRLYATGGVAVEKGLYAFYRVAESGVRRSHGESIEGIQWSATGGFGVEFAVNNSTGLYFDPTVAYYFDNNQPLSIRTSQPLQFKFELGFRFHL